MEARVMTTSVGKGRVPQQGYTVIETLVVLMLLGVVLLVGIPNLRRAQVASASRQALRSVTTLLDLARSEAVKRHSPVGVNFDDSDSKVLVFEDWDPAQPSAGTNDNGVPDLPPEDVLRSMDLGASVRLVHPTSASAIQVGFGDTVIFRPDGSPQFGSGAPTSPAVYLGDQWGNYFRIRINQWTGRLAVEQYLGNSGWTEETTQWTWRY